MRPRWRRKRKSGRRGAAVRGRQRARCGPHEKDVGAAVRFHGACPKRIRAGGRGIGLVAILGLGMELLGLAALPVVGAGPKLPFWLVPIAVFVVFHWENKVPIGSGQKVGMDL